MVKVSKISEFLKADFYGFDYEIDKVTSLDNISDNSLSFSNSKVVENYAAKALILVPEDSDCSISSDVSVIKVKNPRLSFARTVSEFFIIKRVRGVHDTAVVGRNCCIGDAVSVGAHSVIGNNVSIGNNSVLNNNVVLSDNVVVGENCYIKSGSIIGEDGFGFEFDEDGVPIRIPHIGNAIIGDNVEVGSNTVIARGTINSTVIGNNVKIDDQVFIAHNCYIGSNTVITASSEISGSVKIGEYCWIGPNSSIIQKVKIGNKVTIGIGTVVTSDVGDNKKLMGLNGIELRNLVNFKKKTNFGM